MYISEATISLIKPIIIPDLFLKCTELKSDFVFMRSLEDYSQYYTDLESRLERKKFDNPAQIPALGALNPLSRKHSLHSYWRYFRLSIKKAELEGRSAKELYFLLPLVIRIPIGQIKIGYQFFNAKVVVYLFPFGSCLINMDFKVEFMALIDLGKLIRDLKGFNIKINYGDAGTFNKLSHDIVTKITAALFGGQRNLSEFSTHTFIFVRKTDHDHRLFEMSSSHRKAIAAAMTSQNFATISVMTNKAVEDCFEAILNTQKNGEILMFNTLGSFFYADPDWQTIHAKSGDEYVAQEHKLRKSAECMRNNYQSCLNVLFAVNRFLATCKLTEQAGVPKERLEAIKNAFLTAFITDSSNIYYNHAYTKIAPIIGLDKRLKKIEKG